MGLFSRLSPAERTPRPETAERGDTGMAYFGGGTTGAKLLNAAATEYNRQCHGTIGYRNFDRMRFSDPKVAGLRRAMNLPLLRAQARIEPVDPKDERAVEVASFVHGALFARMADPWRAFLSQALLFLDYGCAPFEIVWKLQDGRVLLDRFAYRPPATLYGGISVENGRIAAVSQTGLTGSSLEIPGEKLLWFVNEREGDNWLGRPLLRPMYKPWANKETAEKLLLILLERMGGVPVAKESVLDEKARAALDAAMAAFCVNETGYLRIPEGVEFELATGSISLSEGLELVKYWDTQLSNVAIAQVLDLGKTETGSRALGRTMSDMFVDSLSAVAASIEDTFNTADGPIAQLVAYNFAAAADYVPALRFASLSRLDLKPMAEGLRALYEMGMGFGEETWEWVRAELDLPAREAIDETTPQQAAPEPQNETADAPADEPAVAAAELALGEGSYWRPLTRLEGFVDLSEIAGQLDSAKDAVRQRTQATRDRITAELVKRAQAAAQSGDPAKVGALAGGKAPMLDVLAREIRAVLAEYFEAGRAQVHDELLRQERGEPVIAEAQAERTEGLAMAEAPPRLTEAQARRFYALLDAEAEIAARGIGQASVTATAKQAAAALRSPISAEVMREMATRASDEETLKVGWSVTRVVIAGRAAQAQAEKAQIASATYSAILDGNTCSVCEPRDGEETDDLDVAETWTPNPECEGGERCRCLVIYAYKAGAS